MEKASGAVENAAVSKWTGGEEGWWVVALGHGGERMIAIGHGGEHRSGMVMLEHARGGWCWTRDDEVQGDGVGHMMMIKLRTWKRRKRKTK